MEAQGKLKKIPDYYNPVIGNHYKIGSRLYKCVEQTHWQPCHNCDMRSGCRYMGHCNKLSREDGKNVIFVLLPNVSRLKQDGDSGKRVLHFIGTKAEVIEVVTRTCKICGNKFETSQHNRVYCSEACYQEGNLRMNRERKRKASEKRKAEREKNGGKRVFHYSKFFAKVCDVCGKEYQTPHFNQLTCHDCKAERDKQRTRLVKECVVCGKHYVKKNPKQETCSKPCYYKNKRLKKGGTLPKPVRNCVICGNEFQPKKTTQITCSTRCYQRNWLGLKEIEPKPVAKCIICGTEFKGGRKTCSEYCRSVAISRHSAQQKFTKTCGVCGNEFQGIITKKYCSRKCYNKSKRSPARLIEVFRNKDKAKTCACCGNEFQGGELKKYCSRKCQQKYNVRAKKERLKIYKVDENNCGNTVIITE